MKSVSRVVIVSAVVSCCFRYELVRERTHTHSCRTLARSSITRAFVSSTAYKKAHFVNTDTRAVALLRAVLKKKETKRKICVLKNKTLQLCCPFFIRESFYPDSPHFKLTVFTSRTYVCTLSPHTFLCLVLNSKTVISSTVCTKNAGIKSFLCKTIGEQFIFHPFNLVLSVNHHHRHHHHHHEYYLLRHMSHDPRLLTQSVWSVCLFFMFSSVCYLFRAKGRRQVRLLRIITAN